MPSNAWVGDAGRFVPPTYRLVTKRLPARAGWFRTVRSERRESMLFVAHLLTVSALLFSFAPSAQTESGRERAVALVERLGGKFEVDAEAPGSPIVKIDLHGSAVTDEELEALAGLGGLRHLDLRLTKVGDKGVAHLKRLNGLRFLNLFRTQLGDRGLKQLKELTALETLLIGGTKVTDEGLVHLKSHPRLKKLSLFDTQVSDAGVARLTFLTELETLLIGKSKVTEEGAKALQKVMPKLRFSENM